MKRALLCLLLLSPLAAAYPDKDAWSHLVGARTRIREGERLLDRARSAGTLLGRRQYARQAIARFEDAVEVANRGLQVADASLQDALFASWTKAKKLGAWAKVHLAEAKKAAPEKKKKAKKKGKKGGDGGGRDPQIKSGSYGIVACKRINARRRAIGAPPLCRRGLMR
jgi:hypothetical protein